LLPFNSKIPLRVFNPTRKALILVVGIDLGSHIATTMKSTGKTRDSTIPTIYNKKEINIHI